MGNAYLSTTISTSNNTAHTSAVSDLNGNGFINVAELTQGVASARTVASEIVTNAVSNNTQVIMLGEIHAYRPLGTTIETLRLLRENYPKDKMSYGIEINGAESPRFVEALSGISDTDLLDMSRSDLTKLKNKLLNLARKDMIEASILHDPSANESYMSTPKSKKEAFLNSMVAQYGQELASQDPIILDHIDMVFEAKKLGYNVFSFDSEADLEKILSGDLEYANRRENAMYDAIDCRLRIAEDPSLRIVISTGSVHAMKDAKAMRKYSTDRKDANISETSLANILESNGISIGRYLIFGEGAVLGNIENSAPVLKYDQYDAVYSSQ